MNFLIPDWKLLPSNVGALSTTRQHGASAAPYDDGSGGRGFNLGMHVGDRMEDVLRNRAMLRTALPAEPAWLTQVHGTGVVDAARVAGVPEADASIATKRGVVCVIQTADCLPVLLADRAGSVVGAAHAGWRGLAHGVLGNTLAAMREAGAREILAWMGPAIGPEQFEVGAEVLQAFADRDPEMRAAFRPVPGKQEKYFADIFELAAMTLRKDGVDEICGGGLCTVSDRQRFYSYRRDRTTGRMASMIWLR